MAVAAAADGLAASRRRPPRRPHAHRGAAPGATGRCCYTWRRGLVAWRRRPPRAPPPRAQWRSARTTRTTTASSRPGHVEPRAPRRRRTSTTASEPDHSGERATARSRCSSSPPSSRRPRRARHPPPRAHAVNGADAENLASRTSRCCLYCPGCRGVRWTGRARDDQRDRRVGGGPGERSAAARSATSLSAGYIERRR